jgi:LPS export ABC transporter protein LptC
MAERLLPRKLLALPRFPVVARAIALAVLVAAVAAIGVYLYTRQAPSVAQPEEPELAGDVTAIFENFKHLETKDGVNRYLLTAAVAKAYSNGSHEMTNVELVSFGADGAGKDRVTAEYGIYNQAETLVVFERNVKIETTDGMRVESDRLRYNQETQVLELQGAVKYARQNLEGTCRDALVETAQNRLTMYHDVDMTFRSSDEPPTAGAPTAAEPKAEKKKKKGGKKGKGGAAGRGGGKKKRQKQQAAAGGAAGGGAPAIDFASGPRIPVRIRSGSAVFDKNAGLARYEGGVVVTRADDLMRGDTMTGFLSGENRIRKIESRGNAYLKAAGTAEASAPSMDFLFAEGNQLETAVATGGARLVSLGEPPARTVTGERAEMRMAPGEKGSELRQATADGQAVVTIDAPPATAASPNPSARELRGDHVSVDMHEGGQFASRAEARDNAVLTVTPAKAAPGVDRKRISAARLAMEFHETGNLAREFTAEGGVKVDLEPTAADGRLARTTTSATARADFDREAQDLARVEQAGDFKYVEGDRNAVSDRAVYVTADDLVTLRGATASGRPTVWDAKARTQADEIDIRAKARTSAARGDVRTTYYSPESAGNATPFGKTKSPVFLTAARLDARDADGGVAVYTGAARAWQDDNYVKAETIRLFNSARRMEADGGVETGLYRIARKGEDGSPSIVPVFTTAASMKYSDAERTAHYEGDVVSRQTPDELKSDAQDLWLSKDESATVERMVATGNVLMTEPGRTARGDKLVYTGADQKAVLTGAGARVEDAEQGATTGEELTFYVGGERIRIAGRSGAGRVKSVHRIGKGGSQR